jgi:hypothetical protein
MEKRIILKIVFGFLLFTSIVACTKDIDVPEYQFDKKVLVLNQGNFTEHSASISLYDEVTGTIQNRVFESANGISIGSTVVSGSVAPGKQAYLVCNYPDKIEIIDALNGKIASDPIIDGLASPRNVIVTDTRIYVTNWDYNYEVTESGIWIYPDSYVAVYNSLTKEFIKKVMVGTDAEGLLLLGNRLYVATREGVRVLDTVNDMLGQVALVRPENVTGAAKHLVMDQNYKIWASFPDKGLVKIDPASLEVESVVEVPVDAMDGYIAADYKEGKIYTFNTTFDQTYMPIEANIYSVDVESLGTSILYSGSYFYGVGVSPSSGNVFTAEVSFTSNSVMKTITPAGVSVGTATAGVGTFRFLFF